MTRKDFCKRCSRYAGCGFISRNLQAKCDILQIFEEGYEQGYEDAKNYPRWISVEDELPMEYEPVLAAFGNHYARVCFHCGETWYLNKPLAAEEMEGITHWCHLPQPPKKGGKE